MLIGAGGSFALLNVAMTIVIRASTTSHEYQQALPALWLFGDVLGVFVLLFVEISSALVLIFAAKMSTIPPEDPPKPAETKMSTIPLQDPPKPAGNEAE